MMFDCCIGVIPTIKLDVPEVERKVITLTLPKSMRAIYWDAFYDCSSLTSIIFEGTKAEWNALTKYSDWNGNTGAYIVHCTDGDIEKADS